MTISPEQLRAARGLLSISQDQLAQQAGVAIASIRQFENGTTKKLQKKTEKSLHTFLSEYVEFIGARGVALREENHLLIEGESAKEMLLDDIVQHRHGGELMVLCGNHPVMPFDLVDFYKAIKEKGIPTRHITHRDDLPYPLKRIPEQFGPMALQLVYGSTVAQMVSSQKIQLTRSNLLAEGFGQVFELLWRFLPEGTEQTPVVEGGIIA